jgi:hypothetical protein
MNADLRRSEQKAFFSLLYSTVFIRENPRLSAAVLILSSSQPVTFPQHSHVMARVPRHNESQRAH